MVSVLAADRRCNCMIRLYGQVVDIAGDDQRCGCISCRCGMINVPVYPILG